MTAFQAGRCMVAIAAVLGLIHPRAASASSIGVSFYCNYSAHANRAVASGNYAGVEPQRYWNNWAIAERWASGIGIAGLVDSDGEPTTLTAAMAMLNGRTHNHMWAQATPGSNLSTGDNQLMAGGEDGSVLTVGQDIRLDLAKVPYATYDLVVYAGRHNSFGGQAVDLKFSIAGRPDLCLRTIGFMDGVFDGSTATTVAELDSVGPADYVRFTGLRGDISIVMAQVAQAGGNSNQGGGWSGFQVIESASPGGLLLLFR